MSDPVRTRPDAGPPTLLAVWGGRRGIVDGALPPVVFVAAHANTGLVVDASAGSVLVARPALGSSSSVGR